MIHLTKEGDFPNEMPRENPVFKNNIIIRRDFTGKKLTPEEFQEFQKIVNRHRPYSSFDFVPQTFIPDLSHIR